MSRELSLRQVLDSETLLSGFREFCKVQHADENIEFWLAVEMFRESFRDISSPPMLTSPRKQSSKRSLFGFPGLSRANSSRSSASFSGDDIGVEARARKIMMNYLVDCADKWVCIDQAFVVEIKRNMEMGIVNVSLFDAAQSQVFSNMERDLVPRFAKSFEDSEALFEPSVRGSVRYVPDEKLRASLRTIAGQS